MNQSSSQGKARAELTVSNAKQAPPTTEPSPPPGPVTGRFQAVINTHDCNLHQIQVAIEANRHTHDPHPIKPGEYVSRHPVLLACYDPSKVDEQGQPLPGQPAELDIDTIRRLYSTRYTHVSAEPPPPDASHIEVSGMHFIAEFDSAGQATGTVRLGSPSEVR